LNSYKIGRNLRIMHTEIIFKSIGRLSTSFLTLENSPIQNSGTGEILSEIEIFEEFADGLKDLDGFSHLILLYHLHKVTESKLIVKPFMDTETHGIFATRSPVRPNPIGLTVVECVEIQGNRIKIKGADMLDGTPLLDIKPWLPTIDSFENARTGWLDGKIDGFRQKKSDNRFVSN